VYVVRVLRAFQSPVAALQQVHLLACLPSWRFDVLPRGGLHGTPRLWRCGYRNEGVAGDHPVQGDRQQGSRHGLIPAEWVSSPG
jgi:hypothetical protein